MHYLIFQINWMLASFKRLSDGPQVVEGIHDHTSSSASFSSLCGWCGARSVYKVCVNFVQSAQYDVSPGCSALWANHLKGWCIFWNWPLSGLQDVEVCAGLLQSVSRGAAECVQGYRVCAGCSFNILPCSSRLNQKIFYWKKKYFIWMCIKNKNYMENWLFWGLNLGNLKQCMMIMLVLTSSSSAWTLCSLLHISSLINICNFYSFWATWMVLTSKWGRILQEIHCQCQIWLKWSAAGRRPANFHKRNYLLSVNTTDFEKTTIQAHSAM